MSSFNKRAKSLKRTHRERAQPRGRERLGLLEKHKDYVLRAKDYQRKKAHLHLLKEKARNRNPDEFYFKMINTRLRDGCHVTDQPEEKHSPEELQIMKTQDTRYVNMKHSTEAKKVERLQSCLHLTTKDKPNSHTIFVDSIAEDLPAVQDRVEESQEKVKELSQGSRKLYKELKQRSQRCKELKRVAEKMTTQKNLMAKGRRIKVPSTENNPRTYKWKQERKR